MSLQAFLWSRRNQKFYYKISDNRILLIEDEPFVEFKFEFEKFHDDEVNKGIRMMENSIRKAPIPGANITLAYINIFIYPRRKSSERSAYFY